MSDAGDPGQAPPPPPPVPPGGWQAPTPPAAPPPLPPQAPQAGAYGAPPPTAPAYPAAPPAGYGQPQPQAYTYGYTGAPKNDGMAIAALVCGIVAIPFFCGIGLVLGILGLVFGIISMRKIDRSGGMLTGRGMALAGAICGGVGVAINVLYWGAAIIIAISDSSS